jgi:hypothetical protein
MGAITKPKTHGRSSLTASAGIFALSHLHMDKPSIRTAQALMIKLED